MKMSDVFSLPVKCKKESRQISCLFEKARAGGKFGIVNTEAARYVTEAINSHDKHLERIDELERFIELLQLDVSDDVRRCKLMGRDW